MRPTQKLLAAYRSYRERPRDRGAVIVEAALAIPILLLVIMGSIEFGFAWEARSASASAVRTGLLRAASIGDKPETDMRILQSVIGEVGADNVLEGRVQWVIVFEKRAGVDEAATIASCDTNNGSGFGENCVKYDATVLQNIVGASNASAFQAANFDVGVDTDETTAEYDCAPLRLDSKWCAPKRTENGDVELGVAIRYQHRWFTGILPFNAPNFQDTAVSSTFLEDGANISPTGVMLPTGNIFSSDLGALAVGSTPALFTHSGDGSGTIVAPGNSAHDTERLVGPLGDSKITVGPLSAPPGEVCFTFEVIFTGGWEPATHGGAAARDHLLVDIGQDGGPVSGQEDSPGTYDADLATLNANGRTDGTDYDLTGDGNQDGWKQVIGPVCDSHLGGPISIDIVGDVSHSPSEHWYLGNVNITSP